jgi:hypothetical protein
MRVIQVGRLFSWKLEQNRTTDWAQTQLLVFGSGDMSACSHLQSAAQLLDERITIQHHACTHLNSKAITALNEQTPRGVY